MNSQENEPGKPQSVVIITLKVIGVLIVVSFVLQVCAGVAAGHQ